MFDSIRRMGRGLFLTLIIFLITVANTEAENISTGVTGKNLPESMNCIGFEPAKLASGSDLSASVRARESLLPVINAQNDWVPLDTVSNVVRIPERSHYTLQLNGADGSIAELRHEYEVEQIVWQAVERTPRWLRADLLESLSRFSGDAGAFYREMLADIVVNCDDNIVDEAAFTIANISHDLWSRGSLYYQLIEENALGIYAADEALDYVRVVDHGSVDDDNFYSTLEYQIKTADEDTVSLEIDPYYYYWWVLHPRISDEIPIYINPETGNPESPNQQGVFWRDYLFNHADEDYPLLSEMLEDCGVLWSNLHCNGTAENGAVGVVNQWVRQSMVFDSRQERPIQPVRIYHLHMGRCGEHQDLTAAAARAALIPAAASSNICNDHVWNEFYAGRWVVWEPVQNNIDDSLRYEGRQIPGIYKYRGDGFSENVTSRYTEGTATLNIELTDSNELPVDGARIIVYSEYLYPQHRPFLFCNFAFTDCNGEATITIGDQRNIFIRIDSDLARYPENANANVQVVEMAEDGAVYNWSHSLDCEQPGLNIHAAEEIDDPANHFNLILDYAPQDEIIHGRIWQYSSFFAKLYTAKTKLFFCDEINYQRFLRRERFEALNQIDAEEDGRVEFSLPTDENWYAVFSNFKNTANLEDMEVTAYWSRDSEWSAPGREDADLTAGEFSLAQNYPNPFNSSTNISFNLRAASEVELTVTDLTGRIVAEISSPRMSAGSHTLRLNAGELQSGVYLYTLSCEGFNQTRKLVVIK